MRTLDAYETKALARLCAKFTPVESGCWEWHAASVPPRHYGVMFFRGRMQYAHRVSYQLHVGPVPEGLDLDHLCRTPPCVNPAHLEPVTRRENLLRGDTIPARNASKTHCDSGHEYTAENTYHHKDGARSCRKCGADRAAVKRGTRADAQ